MDYPKSLPDVYLHDGKFTDGTPDGSIPPSRDPAKWNNDVTNEILNVIIAAGMAPDEFDCTQLRQAVVKLIADGTHSVRLKGVTFALGVADGNLVKWDAGNNRFDKSGTDMVGVADVTNSEVVCFGETRAGLFAGLTPGARYYSGVAGAVSSVQSEGTAFVGIAKAVNTMFVDIDPAAVNAGTLPTAFCFVPIAQNGATPATQIDFGAGAARSSDDTTDIRLSASLTKRLDAAWAAGTGNGGLFTGVKAANTWYHCFMVKNPTTGAVDAGFDTSLVAANRPAAYTKYKRVWSIRTDASGNISNFVQRGKENWWKTVMEDFAYTNAPVARTLKTVRVPTGVRVRGLFGVVQGGNAATVIPMILDDPSLDDQAPMMNGAPKGVAPDNNSFVGMQGRYPCWTNTVAQVAVRIEQGMDAYGVHVSTEAYLDPLEE